jgi:Ca2+-binding EF-hand superfamily protein
VTAKLSYLKGDVNGDGHVTLKDVTLLFQYVNNQITKDKLKVFDAADVNGDSKVTLKDVTKVFQYVNNQIASL